jgi:predicted acylesterase/phospholipase RssA
MRASQILATGIALVIVAAVSLTGARKLAASEKDPGGKGGTAVIMTGAAARIPQEAALLEALYDRGLLKDVVFISGVSSGALNAVMLNGILSGKITWGEYKKLLFSLSNRDVFVQDGRRLPVDTEPLRKYLTGVVEGQLGYHSIGDLPVTTSISFTHISEPVPVETVYRMCSRKINNETDTTLSLVDILLASTSFPVAFPPVRIHNVKTIPDVGYIDGGVGDDHVPFRALLEFEKYRQQEVSKVYIVSRKGDSIPEISEELKLLGVNDKGLFDRSGISLDNILQRGMLRRLQAYSKQAPDHVPNTYVWVPDFKAVFPMFNFDNLEEQYEMTSAWAKTHQPVPLEEYIRREKMLNR